MPYINKDRRTALMDVGLEELLSYIVRSTPPGDLNYIITMILSKALGENPNYARFNEIMGIIECCKQEIYRRKIAKYEDQKIKENGDVY
ncbi:MAG: hypothetical protein KAW92_10700 [Candidatus Cloacimonetes bacterium]|nr:hypothetical protein [Candidatus Cloacimonadota bacterium]